MGTRELLATTLVVALLLFLLLTSGDLFLGKMMKVLPRLEDKKRAVQIVFQALNLWKAASSPRGSWARASA